MDPKSVRNIVGPRMPDEAAMMEFALLMRRLGTHMPAWDTSVSIH